MFKNLRFILLGLVIAISHITQAQNALVKGKITDEKDAGIEAVSISIEGKNLGTVSDKEGKYNLSVPTNEALKLVVRHIGYETTTRDIQLNPGQEFILNITLKRSTQILEGVEVEGQTLDEIRQQVSVVTIDPKSAEALPSPFGDFNKILSTLPGVVSNNELSSTYSVRGGSFEENLVYVNDIPIYRPFLVTAGRQEGLSFVNPTLVESVEFSAGGWQPKYGDKLSSTLNVQYKEPTSFAASANLGLLGGGAHVEGALASGKVSYVVGVRHKQAQYLLNSLETEGQYFPKFTDVQSYVNIKLGENKTKGSETSLGILTSFARNRYLVVPESRETEFGTFNASFRLFVAFDGREILEYDTYQNGIKFSHRFNDKFKTDFIASGVIAREREFTDVEGGYRLCDVDNNIGSQTFNECVFTRGIGTLYDYGRNTLEAEIYNLESRNQIELDEYNHLEFGFGYSRQNIDDVLSEFDFIDSADFVTNIQSLDADNSFNSNQYTAYVQNTTSINYNQTLTYGVRFNYWDFNEQFLVSPRLQYAIRPAWRRDVVFKAAVGYYQQPPFYRELRDFSGNVNDSLRAQSSIHFIAGIDHNVKLWGRDFKFLGEAYYKLLRDVVPYDVDNVRLRYYANNDAKAFATGVDLRFSGEFIPGTESWFSLGILSTREDVEGDDNGFIRRPSDQRINLGIFFQDHLPGNPSVRVSVNVLVGTGLPFGPPGDFDNRAVFNGDSFRRVDMGFSKVFDLNRGRDATKTRSLSINAEVLNLLGAANAVSYIWITDVNNQQFAIPNSLSARFLNLRLAVRI
ncbi:MAG: TonB-dependent receptor [Bacteroidota bacterium]